MNNLILTIFVLALPVSVYADSQTCSQYVQENEEYNETVEFLKQYSGNFKLGECNIELIVCGSYSSQNDRGSSIGDLLITDKKGREFYVPLYLPEAKVPGISLDLKVGSYGLHYEFHDSIKDPIDGRFRRILFEMQREWGTENLKRIEIGYHTTENYQTKSHKHYYQWAICE